MRDEKGGNEEREKGYSRGKTKIETEMKKKDIRKTRGSESSVEGGTQNVTERKREEVE